MKKENTHAYRQHHIHRCKNHPPVTSCHSLGSIWLAGMKSRLQAGGSKPRPGATEAPHSFQGWGLFSRSARPPASPALLTGSLQGNSTKPQVDGGLPCQRARGRRVWIRLARPGRLEPAREVFINSLTQVSECRGFFMACRLKGPPGSLDSSKKRKVLGVDAEER